MHSWINRYDGTLASLMDRSRKPHRHPSQHTEAERDLVLRVHNLGRLHQVITRSDTDEERVTEYHYDDFGRVQEVLYPAGDVSVGPTFNEYYQYDEYDRVVAKLIGLVDQNNNISHADSRVIAFGYDDLGRTSKVKYDYYGANPINQPWPIQTITIPDPDDSGVAQSEREAVVKYEYEATTDLVTTVTEWVDGAMVSSYYEYDPQGLLLSYTPALPADYGTITYTYNTAGQKTSMTVPLGVANEGRKISYLYDAEGRQVGMDVLEVTTTSATALDTTTNATETTFAYDNSRNRVRMTTKAGQAYSGTYYFVYDPTASVPSVIYEQGPEHRYLNIREPGGSLVSRERYDADGTQTQSRTYHFDGLGSTVALTDENGEVTDIYVYDAWGNVTNPPAEHPTADNPYRYVGEFGYYAHYQE